MTRRKQGLGLFGLLAVAVLGVMAFAATAQAVTLPVFLIAKKLALHASVDGVPDGGLELLLVEGSNLRLKCPEFEVKSGLILTYEDADAILLYKSCKAFNFAGTEELPCHVSDVKTGNPASLHVTAEALLLPVEFGNGTFGVLAENIVAIVNFLSGTGCPIPLKNEIKGEVCFRITAITNDTIEPLIESDKTIQGECPERELVAGQGLKKDKLLFGVNEAFIDGKAKLKLTGAHEKLTLGVSLDIVP